MRRNGVGASAPSRPGPGMVLPPCAPGCRPDTWYPRREGSTQQDHEDGARFGADSGRRDLGVRRARSPGILQFPDRRMVIMLTGVAGLVIPRRGYRWVRRVIRRPRGRGGGRRCRADADRLAWEFRLRPHPVVVTAPPP